MPLLIALCILVLDRASKIAVLGMKERLPVHVIPGIFDIDLALNKGGAFSILQGRLEFFIAVSILSIIIISFILFSRGNKAEKLTVKIALSFILGGAAGNLIDRIFLGAVVNFFDFHVWPVFNIADSAISIGVLVLAYEIIFMKRRN